MSVRRTLTLAILILAASFFGYLNSRPVTAQPEPRGGDEADADAARLLTRLTSNVVETGYVESASSVELGSELQEPTTIRTVVPEGILVKKGDLLVELDSSELEAKLAEQKVKLAISEAELRSAKEELSIARELQEVVGLADESRLAAAIRRQESYLADDGEFRLKSERLKIELNLAKTRIGFATNNLKRLERSAEHEGELAAARLELSDANAQAVLLEVELRLLEQHEKTSEVADRELTVLAARANLIRNRGELGKRVRVASSELVAAEARVEQGRQVLENLKRQIAACQIHAPRDGVVIYANQFSRRGAAEFNVEAGATLRPRQTIIQLPDMSRLQLRVAVNETKIAKIRAGQSVSIQLDALAGVRIRGRVSQVNQYPEPAGFASGGIRQYGVIVSIIDPPQSVRLGMTAFAEIDVTKKADE